MKRQHRDRLKSMTIAMGRLKAQQVSREACEALFDAVAHLQIVEVSLQYTDHQNVMECVERLKEITKLCTNGLRGLPIAESKPLMRDVCHDAAFDLKRAVTEAAKKVAES